MITAFLYFLGMAIGYYLGFTRGFHKGLETARTIAIKSFIKTIGEDNED